MSEEIQIDGEPLPLNVFTVYRPDGKRVMITGPDSCDVRNGALLLLKRSSAGVETVSFVFASGQWLTVNTEPA